MSTTTFEAPDMLAPYVDRVRQYLADNPGSTSAEIQKGTGLGENLVRVTLDRLASLKQVHCTLRQSRRRGGPPREYRPGPCPVPSTHPVITVN